MLSRTLISRTVAVLALGSAVAAGLAACGDNSGATLTAPTATMPASHTTAPHTTASHTTASRSAATSAKPAASFHERKVSDRRFGFYAPSRNIMCLMSQDGSWHGVRCDVREKTWQLPPKPADCPWDFGNGLELGRTARLHCATDSIVDEVHTTAAYGDAFTAGSFRCEVTRASVRCDNTKTGHGFTAARQAYTVY